MPGEYSIGLQVYRIRCTFSIGVLVGHTRQCNRAAHEPFLRAPCSWGKRQWISSPGHEEDEKQRLFWRVRLADWGFRRLYPWRILRQLGEQLWLSMRAERWSPLFLLFRYLDRYRLCSDMAVYPQTVDSLNDLFNEAKTERTYGSVNSTRAHPPPRAFLFSKQDVANAPWWGQHILYKFPWWGFGKRANTRPMGQLIFNLASMIEAKNILKVFSGFSYSFWSISLI